MTQVQIDELCRVPDVDDLVRRVALLLRFRARLVLTSIVVPDVSRFGLANWGGEDAAAAFERHVGTGAGRGRHAEDATIGATAHSEVATLVTLERKDLQRSRRGHPDLRVIG